MTTELHDHPPAAATPEHLTEALRRHGVLSTGRVANVTMDAPRDMPVSAARIVRLKLTYEGPAETAPASLILKTWQPSAGVPESWSAREVLFYDTLAPATPADLVLRCFDTGQSPQTKSWHLLLEDVTDSHRIPDDPPLPPTEPQCRAIVSALARFHAAWWDTPQAEIDTVMAGELRQRFPGFWAHFVDRLGDRLSADRRRIFERFFAAPPHAARMATRKNLSIMHGDAHVWNVFLPNDDSAGGRGGGVRLFDWSSWRAGLPATDLAFMMAMNWYPERRRRFERPLLDHYHASLLAAGVAGYDRTALDLDYRLALMLQMLIPVIWASMNIPTAIWWNNFERIMMAVDDLDCRELLV